MMKNNARLYMMMAMAGMFSDTIYPGGDSTQHLNLDELRNKVRNMRQKQIKQKGCSEFSYPGVTIIALNKKNADRKYEKYLKLIK
jgi:hypothetical protein